jgi:membrane protein DedA with SNARE-associated domain
LLVEEFLRDWGYLGIFLGLVATGVGFPMPEELPVVIGGVLAGSHPDIYWFIMLPVCIAGVIVGDAFLYAIGRFWGPRLLEIGWIKRRVFPPDRLAKIERNFHEYGVKLLLFARLTPGVRAPIFFTAGLTKLPVTRFLLADGIYAVPGVSFLFFLGWWFTDSMIDFVEGPVKQVKSIIAIVVIAAVIAYFVYRVLRKPAVTGDPHEMPQLVEQVTHRLEQVSTKIRHPISVSSSKCPPADRAAPHADGQLNAANPTATSGKDSKTSGPPN